MPPGIAMEIGSKLDGWRVGVSLVSLSPIGTTDLVLSKTETNFTSRKAVQMVWMMFDFSRLLGQQGKRYEQKYMRICEVSASQWGRRAGRQTRRREWCIVERLYYFPPTIISRDVKSSTTFQYNTAIKFPRRTACFCPAHKVRKVQYKMWIKSCMGTVCNMNHRLSGTADNTSYLKIWFCHNGGRW